MWAIWKARNLHIFEGKELSALGIMHQITYSLQLYCPPAHKVKKTRVIGPDPIQVFPCGYFDGAFANYVGGVGYCLHLNESHSFEFALGVGNGSNTKAELLGLWALLLTSHMMGIPLTHIFGDSSVIINWEKGSTPLSPPDLYHWCRETQKLFTCFPDLSFSHIYREHNRIADRLSKTALTLAPGFGCFLEFFEDLLVTYDTFQLF